MKNIFFILIFLLLNHKIFSSVFWVCPNNYGSDLEYNIVKNEVYIKKNNNWQLLYKNKIDKTDTKERIIYIRTKTNKNILYKEIFDLKRLTIQIFSESKDDNQSFELMPTRQYSLL